jgi:hypothetical protein
MGEEQAVLVTTAHRGVFFGYTAEPLREIVESKIVSLSRARNVVYWPTENKGFLGLAAYGPKNGARVGPPANITLNDVTSVAVCAPETVELWEKHKWSK